MARRDASGLTSEPGIREHSLAIQLDHCVCRSSSDGDDQALGRLRAHPVGGGDGLGVRAALGGCPREGGGAVGVSRESDAGGERAGPGQRGRRVPGGGDREAEGRAHRGAGAGGTGDGRRLVDRQGKGLGGRLADPVRGGDRQVVQACTCRPPASRQWWPCHFRCR